jgi:hypothetical protein
MQCSLDDCIRFRVDCPYAVSVYYQMTDFVTMLLPGRRAVEASGQDAFIEHKHATHKCAVACTAF